MPLRAQTEGDRTSSVRLEWALLDGEGFVVIDDVVGSGLISRMRAALLDALQIEFERLSEIDAGDPGRVQEVMAYGSPFLELLTCDEVFDPVERTIGTDATLYTCSGSCLAPGGGTNSTSEPHQDIRRSIPRYLSAIGVMVLLDDFDEVVGATEFLPGSQHLEEAPSLAAFEAGATPVVAPAGSVIYFNPRTWHRAGCNRSDRWRCCIVPAMARPWMRQRFELPAMVPEPELVGQPDVVRRRLGFYARSPQSLEQYVANRADGHYRRS